MSPGALKRSWVLYPSIIEEKQRSALTPFTYRQSSVHMIIVTSALLHLQLRPQNKVKVDIFRVKF